MSKSKVRNSKTAISGWYPETRQGDFEIGLDTDVKHAGTRSAYIKSVVPNPTLFGNLTQSFKTDNYIGKRLQMTAWVRSKLTSGSAHLWLRIDVESESSMNYGGFDNMDDRPIKGETEWSKYRLVVDVPKDSTDVVFGFFLDGTGTAWLDDVNFEVVSKDVALTGPYTEQEKKFEPENLDFESTVSEK